MESRFAVNCRLAVQGVFYTPSRGHQGTFEVKLDNEGFDLAVEMTQIINRLRTENEASNILYDVRCSLFTILSAANMLQADYTPGAQCVSEAMEFVDWAIPDFANGSGFGWSAESTLREVFSKIKEYSLAFILDSMSTMLKEFQDDEGDAVDYIFLVGDVYSLMRVKRLIPQKERNKLEDLEKSCFNLKD